MAFQTKTRIENAAVINLATRRARDGPTKAPAPRNLRLAARARVNPARFRQRARDAMTRFRLADLPRFVAKLRGVARRQTAPVQPEMNHFMLENFFERDGFGVAKHAANLETGVFERESVDEKRNRELDHAIFDIDISRRARELATPFNLTRRKLVLEPAGVDLGVEFAKFSIARHGRQLIKRAKRRDFEKSRRFN